MDILYRSAFALARDIKAGNLKSRDVLEFFISRMKKYNGALNAIVATDLIRARALADAADAAAGAGEDWGPLHGVPLTIKDALMTEGLVTVGGLPDCKDFVPEENAVGVQRYVDAGAIVFGKTNVPLGSGDLQSYNEIYGTTNNPWNVERTCGGSSGGAAASVAAGMTPLELGSDIGGSIRTPSSFNGVFGHKSSFGIISKKGHLPPGPDVLQEGDLSVLGPIGTCVDDITQAFDLLIGPGKMDAKGWKIDLPQARTTDPAKLRVATYFEDEFCPTDSEVIAQLNSAADSLEKAGATVTRGVKPDFELTENHTNFIQLLMAAMGDDYPQSVKDDFAKVAENADPDDVSPLVLQARGVTMSHGDWCRLHDQRLALRAKWEVFFEDYDVLLCPATNVPAFAHDHHPDFHARSLSVNGADRPYFDILIWAGFSLNSYLPATVAPAGLTSDNMPVGVQIVGPYLEDRTTLAVAGMLEKHHRRFQAPDGYS